MARLLESVDPARDSVLVVAPYHSEAAVHLTVAGMRGPGIEPGLLRSGSTRRAGLVTLVDIAPTILDLAGVERPDSMEGRRFEPVTGGPATGIERAEYLAEHRPGGPLPGSDGGSRRRHLRRPPGRAVDRRDRGDPARRARGPAHRGAGRALPCSRSCPATYLAGLVDFHASPATAYWVFVVGLAVALAVAATAVGGRTLLDPLLLVLGVVFGLAGRRHARWARHLQLNTVFGYSPTVGGRFAGMGNLAYGHVRGRRVPPVRAAVAPVRRSTASVRRWPSACSCWPS